MNVIQAIIVGLIQGLTEFLPISSSGHLILTQYFLGFGEGSDLSFEIFLHLGTLIAVMLYFKNDIIRLLMSLVHFKNPDFQSDRKISLWLIIATAVTGGLGIVFKDTISKEFTNPILVSTMIGLTGIIVYYSDKIKEGELDSSKLTIHKSILIGFCQAIAIIPGISRSGTTITISLLTGLKRSQAATFSFLLSIPVILGANISEIKTFTNLNTSQLLIYLIGFTFAFISGFIVIKWLMNLIVKARLRYFAYYCWGISIISIGLILYGF